jgi:glyoxylase-like metal-dependent hydrolase (beta-lactamase superfamily II)
MTEVAQPWFERRYLGEGITLVTETHVHRLIRCNVWHVAGRDRDLVIDSGLGIVSLRAAARDLFETKVTAVATHAHFDHVGGMHEFDDRLIHRAEGEHLAEALDGMALTCTQLGDETLGMLTEAGYAFDDDLLIDAMPREGFDPTQHRLVPCAATAYIAEGDILDCGDRAFEVLHLPGHSPGSIGLYERGLQILFAGDAIYDGPLLGDLPGSDRQQYVSTLRRLMTIPVSVAHCGHEGSMGQDRLREIARDYLQRWDR